MKALALAALLASVEPEAVDRSADDAYRENAYAFCTAPRKPLMPQQRIYCSMADAPGCEALKAACGDVPKPPKLDWLEAIAKVLAPLAKAMLYLVLGAILLAVLVPIVRAALRYRRQRKIVPAVTTPNVAVAQPADAPATSAAAEELYALAERHREAGELEAALALYLEAALAALDRRGAIRRARHRTNGEYVRACSEEAARPALREIVRDVDRVEFGGQRATGEDALRVARRALAILGIAATLFGCSLPRRGDEPGGTELPMDVLSRNGFVVKGLETSIASLPSPERDAPVLVIDFERVTLEAEAREHLARWVEEGGVLVALGAGDFAGGRADAEGHALDVAARSGLPGVQNARVARAAALEVGDGDPVAFVGDDAYAVLRRRGEGVVLGLANDDLFTNVAMRHPRDPAALVLLVRLAAGARKEVRVARAEDGIPPPSNPFSALVAAGLAKGAWHALAASLVLFLAVGRRFGRARPVTKAGGRRAFVEHVEATGAFYGRARAFEHALAAYGRYVELRLREVVPRGADAAPHVARATGEPLERVTELLAQARDGKAEDPLVAIEHLRRLLSKLRR